MIAHRNDHIDIAYLADEHVLLVKVTTEHLRCFTGYWLDLYADLLTLARRLHRLVIELYARHDAQVEKL